MGSLVKIDQKGRLKIPATLSTLHGFSGELYVTGGNGHSVRIYPIRIWNRVEERLEHLCSRNQNNRKLLARAKYFGQAVRIDKQGRVLIPMILRNTAQMRGAVDVLDYANYLEVWNHAEFLKSLRRNPITPKDEKILQKLSSAPQLPWEVPTKRGRVPGAQGRRRRHLRDRTMRGTRTNPAGQARVA